MVSQTSTLASSHTTSKINKSSSLRQNLMSSISLIHFICLMMFLKGTRINVASRYKVARPLKSKKSSKVAFVLEAIYKKDGAFKYPKVFQCDNGVEFKREVTKLLEKHNVDIRRATTKYKHTHTAFVEAFNRELAKLLFKLMDAQELQDPEMVSTIWVKN